MPRDERLPASRVFSHLFVMGAVAVIMGIVAACLALPFAGMVGLVAKSASATIEELPAELETQPLAQRTQVVDSRGDVIATFYDENRINVSLRQVSRQMVKAIIAIEDERFYEHGALDLRGTLRAFVTNQAEDGVVQGGSTITQQMVKMTLIAQAKNKKEVAAATDDTYERKLRELRYAIAFEENYSKDWILERYLNIAYFGDGAHGIQAAAKHYFNKNAKELNLRESAMLAGIVKNPSGFDPTNAPDRTLERRNVVLEKLAQVKVITDAKAEKLKGQKLGLDLQPTPNGCVFSRAPFFCDYLRNYLLKDESLGKTVAARKRLLDSGGLTIRTTLDTRFQDAADKSVKSSVFPTDQAIGALAMVEPRTGEVRAISQSRPMGRLKKKGETYLNYVVNKKYGDSNGFQPGSTFKSFVLAAAIAKGVPPSTQIRADQEMKFPMNSFPDCGGHNFYSSDTWTVGNSTGAGTFNLYKGTQQSVNTFYAQLERITGLCEPYKLAKRMGVELTDPATERVPSFTLGVADVSPLEMAEAYATFAGRGLHCDARPVTAIEDAKGNLIKEYDPDCQQVMQAGVADYVNDILRGVQEPGGFGYSNGVNILQQSAGKTGTTQDGKAVWFMGYTPNLTTAAMIAGANSQGQPIGLAGQVIGGVYRSSASGSGFAGPMWAGAMDVVQQWLPDETFTRPTPLNIQGATSSVPGVAGYGVDQASALLRQAGFNVVVGSSVPSSYGVGTVAGSTPGAGTVYPRGGTIVLSISSGAPPKQPKKGPRRNGNGR